MGAGARVGPGAEEPVDDALVEESDEAARRVEDVERAARRRGVEDDEVVRAAVQGVVQALHRDVGVRGPERAAHQLVEPVAEDQ